MNVSHTYRHPRGESDKRKLELVISRRSLGDHPHLCAHTPLYVPDVGRKEQRPEDNHLSSRVIYQLGVPFCGSWPFVMCFGAERKESMHYRSAQETSDPAASYRIAISPSHSPLFSITGLLSKPPLCTGLQPVISPSRALVFAYVNFLHTSHRVHSLRKAHHTTNILDGSLLAFQRTSFSLFQPTKQDGSPTKIMKHLVS